MFDLFNHTFMVYALIIGLALGLGAALLSSFLVLNNQSMISDGLSHVAFTGIIFGLLISPNQPIYIAILISIVAAILITYLGQLKMIEQDAAIGVISAFTLAIGLITVSVAKDGFNTDIESLLTGYILSSTLSDVIIAIVTLIILVVFVLLFYRQLLSSGYDPLYAKFSKINHTLLKYLLSILTSVFVVIGVRTVGMLLISSFVIFPSLIASQISRSFKQNVIISLVSSFVIVFIGIVISYDLDLPTGSTIVVCYFILLVISIITRKSLRRS